MSRSGLVERRRSHMCVLSMSSVNKDFLDCVQKKRACRKFESASCGLQVFVRSWGAGSGPLKVRARKLKLNIQADSTRRSAVLLQT